LASPAEAQSPPDPAVAAILENGKRLTTIDKKRCPQPIEGEEIVVCADDQRVFKDGPSNEDRIRPGESISATRAAECIGSYPACAHRLHQLVGTKFGNVPPPAIPFAEFMKDLPEPDLIVPENEAP
jgi:hypothetical protein